MKLLSVLQEECIVPGMAMKDKGEALREIVRAAKRSPELSKVSEDEILRGLEERESLGSTGFGKGVAIPHCRLESVARFVVGLITVPEGVDFESHDGEKVTLIVFVVGPTEHSDAHIKLLSAISQALIIPGSVEEILAETTAVAIRESFLRHTRSDIETIGRTEKNLLRVVVHDENVLRDLLQALTGVVSGPFEVIEALDTSVYFAKMALFAGLWRDDRTQIARIIHAVVDKPLTNEAIRRIESVTGDLDECTTAIVMVHELSYCAGTLERGV